MTTQTQSFFQQRQELMAKQKLQRSLDTICERRSWHHAQQLSSICRPAIDHLSRKDAQWLANKNYTDLTKVHILIALGEEEEKNNQKAPHKRDKRIFGAAAIAGGAATAIATHSFHNPKTTLTATCLMGLFTLGTLIKWAYHTGRYDGIHAGHMVRHVKWYNVADKNPNFQKGLKRLMPHLYQPKTKV